MALSEIDDERLEPGALIASKKMMYEVITYESGIIYADDCVNDKRFAFVVDDDFLKEFKLVRAAPHCDEFAPECSSSATSI